MGTNVDSHDLDQGLLEMDFLPRDTWLIKIIYGRVEMGDKGLWGFRLGNSMESVHNHITQIQQ